MDAPVIVLTDAPEAARPLLADGTGWRPGVPSAAGVDPAGIAALWSRFATTDEVWHGLARPPIPAPVGPRWVLVVAAAPRSNFDALNEQLASGAMVPAGLACVALAGERFRGQRGRAWTALPGNLQVSVHLPLDVASAAAQAGLAALPAVAAARAVEEASQGRLTPRVKWVNDLWLDERKAGGVLVATQVQEGRVRHAVVGVGINVARAPDLPVEARTVPPVALADVDAGGPWTADGAWTTLLRALFGTLEEERRRLQEGGAAAIVAAYRERAAFLGRVATIWPVDEGAAGPLARGRVLELLPDLSLRLEGVAEPIRHGRMTLDPPV